MTDKLESFPSNGPSSVSSSQELEKAKHTPIEGGRPLSTDQMTASQAVASPFDSWRADLESQVTLPFVTTVDQPNLYSPKVSDPIIQETLTELKQSAWFTPSFMATFIAVMQDIMNYDRLNHLQESKVEVKMRDYLFNMAKATSELTKALYEQQSMEKITEAFTHFTSAAISGAQFIQTTKNIGMAAKKVEDKIEAKKQELDTQIRKELKITDPLDNITGADDLPAIQTTENVTKKQRIEANNKKVQDYKNDPATVKSDEVKKLEKKLEEMENSKDYDIRQEWQHEDQKTNLLADTLKQTVQGVGQIIQSRIKLEEGEIESLKQLLEGFIQAFNKYSETSSRARDDAKTAFDRTYDFSNRIIETTFRFQSLSHSG